MKIDLYPPGHRGSEFSEALGKRLCAEASDTPSITACANRVGIPVRVLEDWLRRGRNGSPRFAAFATEFYKVREAHRDRAIAALYELVEDDNPKVANARLNAAKFMLQKHFPYEYADMVRVSTTTTNQTTYNLGVLPTEKLREFHSLLSAVVDQDDDGAEELLRALPIDVEEATD